MFGRRGLWTAGLAAATVVVLLLGSSMYNAFLVNLAALRSLRSSAADPAIGLPEPLTDEGRCRMAHVVGRQALLSDREAAAGQALEEGVACDRLGEGIDDVWAWFDLGRYQHAAGDYEGAAASWQRAGAYQYAALLAQEIASTGDRDGAANAWRLAASVAPDQSEPYINLAGLVATIDPDRAESYLRQAISIEPRYARAYSELGTFYLQQREDPEMAQEFYEQALRYAPNEISLLVRLAENSKRLSETSEAIRYWLQVASLSARLRPQAYFEIGQLALADNNVESALEFFGLAVDDAPQNGEYLFGLAQALRGTGCASQARDLFRQILGLDITIALREKALSELEELRDETNIKGAVCPQKSP